MMTSLPGVPPHLTIRIIYSDENVVVIDKPCDLRSVPGHADPPPLEKDRPRPTTAAGNSDGATGKNAGERSNTQSHRMTAQEAWVKAIQSLSSKEEPSTTHHNIDGSSDIPMEQAAATELLCNLGSTANPSCVPRKFETYVKYCQRNTRRLLPSFPNLHDIKKGATVSKEDCSSGPTQKKQKCEESSKQSSSSSISKANPSSIIRTIAEISYTKIQMKQRPMMNLPKPTEDHESAMGQLRMMGFGEHSHCAPTLSSSGESDGKDARLHVVHRLDCQTSGIMVVARNRSAAATLSQAWRERDTVQKVYLAHVKHWPPYHDQNTSEGTIDIPLAASRSERIKWEVRPLSEGGKECKTYWKVYEDLDIDKQKESTTDEKQGITLELHPITGRTHQLRIHCASIGSGIVGDSLYGDSPIEWVGERDKATTTIANEKQEAKPNLGVDVPKTLRLHAHKLTFPDPVSGEKITLESPKPW